MSSVVLAVTSSVVMGLGLYFVFVRPPLLPEDLHFFERSRTQVDGTIPLLTTWLRDVFRVMGGYMFAMGVVSFYVAVTAFRDRQRGAAVVAALAGAASVGGMAAVNFMIDSNFRWHLLLLAVLWLFALVLYWVERTPRKSRDT